MAALTTSSAEEPSSTAKQLREQVLRVHTAAHSSSTLKSSLTGLVIDRPLVRVGQHLVRVSQVFEELWVSTLVRVVLQRASVSIGLVTGVWSEAEDARTSFGRPS